MHTVIRATGHQLRTALARRREQLALELAEHRAGLDDLAPAADLGLTHHLLQRIETLEAEQRRLQALAIDVADDERRDLTLFDLERLGLDTGLIEDAGQTLE